MGLTIETPEQYEEARAEWDRLLHFEMEAMSDEQNARMDELANAMDVYDMRCEGEVSNGD